MSKSEILEELLKLKADERHEIFERICEMEEMALFSSARAVRRRKSIARPRT
jgi:hypothetical protein